MAYKLLYNVKNAQSRIDSYSAYSNNAMNASFASANSGYISGNSNYLTTNAAFGVANASSNSLNSNWAVTNTAYAVSNSAYGAANAGLYYANNHPISSKPGTVPYAISLSDVGLVVAANSATLYIPNAVFSAGNTLYIYNNTNPTSTSVTITPNNNVLLRYAGLAAGNRTLAANGFAYLVCVQGIESGANVFTMLGSGIT